MNERERKRLEATAYHEAGHAVAGYLLRRRFEYVTIVPEGDCEGVTEFGPLDHLIGALVEGAESGPILAYLRQALVTVLAGPTAEERWSGVPQPLEHLWGQDALATEDDHAQAIDMAGFIGNNPEDAASVLRDAALEARLLWREPRNWAAVDVLAAELLQVQRVEGRRARRVIREVLAAARNRVEGEMPVGEPHDR